VATVGDRTLVLADIPGLIAGASAGAGLGDRFLKHIERCRALIHLIDGTADNIEDAYRQIRAELTLYGRGLAAKPEVVVLTKIDALTPYEVSAKLRRLEKITGNSRVFAISSIARRHITDLLYFMLTYFPDNSIDEKG
jgi:GTP-binding protein